MSSTAIQLLAAALTRGPLRVLGNGPLTADSIGTNYIDDDSEFSYSNYGDTEFQDRFLWRYNLAGSEDEVKQITTVDTDTGRVYIGSLDNYVDQADLEYMILGIHPADLMGCLNTAQRKQYEEALVILNAGTDLDMETQGTAYWDGTSGGSSTSNVTVTKTTTPANVYSGKQALLLTATGANAFCRGEMIRVTGAKSVTVAPIMRADVGKVTFKLWDPTNSQYVGQSIVYTGEEFAAFPVSYSVPSGCEHLQPHFLLEGASDIAVVDCVFGPFDSDKSVFRLPQWMNETYKLPFIRRSTFRSSISGVGDGYDAFSRVFDGDYRLGQEYQVEAHNSASNAQTLSFENGVRVPTQTILWLAARRSLADNEPLLYPSSVTTAPFEQVMAYICWEIADLLEGRHPTDPRWPRLKAEQAINVGEETAARPGPQEQPVRRTIRVGI